MRHLPFVIAAVCLTSSSAGCAAIRGLDEYTTADPAPAAAPPASTVEGVEPVPPPGGGILPAGGCKTNRQCVELVTRSSLSTVPGKPAVPAVCVRATGKCVPLESEDCPRVAGNYENDSAIVLGTLLSASTPSALEQAAFLAAEEINKGSARPLVLVGCNSGVDVLRATRHLAEDLHVPAIVGPTSGEQVIDVTQQISTKAGTLLMTPTSLANAISNLADDDLTWRSTPSDAQRAKLVIEQIKDLENVLRATRGLTTVKLGIVHPTDALGMSARDAISGKLILNGRFINDAANAANVSIDAYQAGSSAAQLAIATKYGATFKPDIVFITAVEQVAEVIVPLENALTVARAVYRPYYVLTDVSRTPAVLNALSAASMPADMKRRIRGVGVKPDASSAPVLSEFRAAFTARYGVSPTDAAAPVAYDATYAIAYSLAATFASVPSGASVARGLRALAVGTPAAVGQKGLASVMPDLASGKAVSLRGTMGLLQWDTSGDIMGGTVEVWCVGAGFGSSGVTMDVQTQVVGGAFVQCQ